MKKKITYNLFLDDVRQPINAFQYTNNILYRDIHWLVVVNYEQFVDTVEKYYNLIGILPTIVSFDHDLADKHYDYQKDIPYDDLVEKTGYDCAKWLVDFCMDNDIEFPEYFVHSMNTVGGDNIMNYISNYKKHINI